MSEIRRIDIKEFREFGFLQELNRLFLHPSGLAMEVIIDEGGNEKLGGIWDYRDDPEGVRFADGTLDADKATRIKRLMEAKYSERKKLLGYVVQPIDKAGKA